MTNYLFSHFPGSNFFSLIAYQIFSPCNFLPHGQIANNMNICFHLTLLTKLLRQRKVILVGNDPG